MTDTQQDTDFQATVIQELTDIHDYFDTISMALVSIQDMLNEVVKTNQTIRKYMPL
jgi:heme-binding NEAT domain protein